MAYKYNCEEQYKQQCAFHHNDNDKHNSNKETSLFKRAQGVVCEHNTNKFKNFNKITERKQDGIWNGYNDSDGSANASHVAHKGLSELYNDLDCTLDSLKQLCMDYDGIVS